MQTVSVDKRRTEWIFLRENVAETVETERYGQGIGGYFYYIFRSTYPYPNVDHAL